MGEKILVDFCRWSRKGLENKGEGKACRESQQGNLIMKTYWEYRQQGNQMIKNLLRANTAGESDNTEARVCQKTRDHNLHSHTHHERHTPRWPADTQRHKEKSASCLMFKSDSWEVLKLYRPEISKWLQRGSVCQPAFLSEAQSTIYFPAENPPQE